MTYRQLLTTYQKKASLLKIDEYGVNYLISESFHDRATYLVSLDDEVKDSALLDILERYLQGNPPQYLLGYAYFGKERFKVDSRVLIPRPETYELVENALGIVTDHSRVLELGTGSGAVAVMLAKMNPNAIVCASDISEAALQVARENAAIHQVTIDFRKGDLFEPWLGEKFDIVIANLPYIPGNEILDPWVMKEPHLALFGGQDGLGIIKRLIRDVGSFLKTNGYLLIEHHESHGEQICQELLKRYGTKTTQLIDLQGKNRFVIFGPWSRL